MRKLCFVFVFSVPLFLVACRGQTTGCTDPLATNYDPAATKNDGSCTYESVLVSPLSKIPLTSVLSETSGLILWNDFIWSFNDNTDTTLYALDPITGEIVEEYPLQLVKNRDWEEISQDEHFIYIGDFGNNGSGNRRDLHILRVEKKSMGKEGTGTDETGIDTLWFSYSDQSDLSPREPNMTDYDCEAMIVSKDSIYLFTKQWISAGTSIYSLPKYPGIYEAKYRGSFDIQGLVTSATYMESKKLVVLAGYTVVLNPFLYLLYDFSGTDFLSGNKRRVDLSLPFHQMEGVTTADGLKYYVSNEKFSFPPMADTPQSLYTFDLSSLLKGYLSTR